MRAIIRGYLQGRDHGWPTTSPAAEARRARRLSLPPPGNCSAKRGYRGTSLAAIAEAAGLSQPGLLHHFRSKNAVLLAVLASRDSADSSISSPGRRTGYRHNRRAGRARGAQRIRPAGRRAVLHAARRGRRRRSPGARVLRAAVRRVPRLLYPEPARAQKEHALAPGIDPEALANVLIAVLDGLQFQWLLDESVDMRASYAALSELDPRRRVTGKRSGTLTRRPDPRMTGRRRGDVIVEKEPADGSLHVRLVIGLPGDRVACCDSQGRMTVNGKALDEQIPLPWGSAGACPVQYHRARRPVLAARRPSQSRHGFPRGRRAGRPGSRPGLHGRESRAHDLPWGTSGLYRRRARAGQRAHVSGRGQGRLPRPVPAGAARSTSSWDPAGRPRL